MSCHMNRVMLDLETLIHDWYWDETSHQFAREAGAYLLQFIQHFRAAGATESKIQENLDNVWLIGAWLCQNEQQETFSPEAFLNEPLFIDQFRFRMRAFPDEVASYESTWHELKRCVRGMGYGD